MLTNSCVKLQTVHHIPLTINKEGRAGLLDIRLICLEQFLPLKLLLGS